MKKGNIIKFILIFLFLIFIGLYSTASSGYYETEERKKMSLTEEQIKLFESDVASGKQIDLENYLKLTDKNYDNKISKTALSISKTISNIFEKGLTSFFEAISKAVTTN